MCKGCPTGETGVEGQPGLYNTEMLLRDLVQDSPDHKPIVFFALLARNRGAWVVFKETQQLVGTPSLGTTLLLFTERSKVGDVVNTLSGYCSANPDKPKAFDSLRKAFGVG